MSETKAAAHPYKSFGQACLLFEEKFERQRKQALPLSKACGNPKGKARGRLRRGEIPQAHSNSASKIKDRKTKLTNQKRNAAKKGKTKRSNENYYLGKTVNLHCAYSNK